MKKVLIVDDDPDICEAVQVTLESENYDCTVVHEAQQVLATVLHFKPDLIIMDIILAGYDGRKVARHLKSVNETKKIPIIMFSAHLNSEPTVREIGVEGFIPKPFELEVLLSAVKKYTSS